MKIFVLVVIFAAYVAADCGCLKCSKHLQGVDINGPNGCPIKVVYKRPNLQCGCDTASYTPIVQAPVTTPAPVALPGKSYNYKIQYYCKPVYQQIDDCGGQQYSAKIQAPSPTLTRAPIPLLNNLKYRTDTVLIPSPTCEDCKRGPAPAPAPPALPADLINWLNNLQLSQSSSSASNANDVVTGPSFERLHCCSCDRLEDHNNLPLSFSPCSCARSKRSVAASKSKKPCKARDKRDLAKHGYNFLMNMLPQFVREPLHHSVQGVHVEPTKSKLGLKEKLEELKLRKAANANRNPYGHDLTRKIPGLRNQHFQADDSPFITNANNFWGQKSSPKYSHFRQTQPGIYEHSSETDIYGSKRDFLKNRKKSQAPSKVAPALAENEDPFLNSKFKSFARKHTLFGVSPRTNAASASDQNETTLLRKLKKLNNNPFSSNIEDQATVFMKELLKPERTRRSAEVDALKTRRKRTIILGSDEIDLPPHYEVDIVSVEDADPEITAEDLEFSDEYEDDSPVVGNSPYLGKQSLFSRVPKFHPKPDVVMGKNVIQKAVREELEAHHKKLEKEQKIKDLRANMQRKHQEASVIPQNPFFLLLTAPMKFLKHFHDLNKGVNPVMTSLPKLVYTAKKYFRDFGKNFQKNCLNLASDIIGDFDHIQPSVIQQISKPDGRRYRRDVYEAALRECLEESRRQGDDIDIDDKGNQIIKGIEADTETGESLDSNIPLTRIDENGTGSRTEPFTPDYTVVFENSKETQNFRQVPPANVRKKRYVIKFVDDREIQGQVEDYLTEKMDDQFGYLKPLKDYYEKVNDFITQLYSSHKPLCQQGDECSYHRPAGNAEPNSHYQEDSFEDMSFPKKKKKIQIKKIKPRVIIDNKGLPFMEYDGFKRPLLLNGKKFGLLKQSPVKRERSSEETGNKIASLIARAKEGAEVVGSSHKDIIPQQIIKERISSLLEEIDQLVHLNSENYDEIFDNLIKIQHIKTSIEQDWKRTLMADRADDIDAKIGLLSKFKDLQQVKGDSVQNIVEALGKNDNEFVRRQLVHSLIRLQKLQCLITSVVEDFEQHLTMKTSFDTKKEIKYVDFLSELKFVRAKTRNDLVRKLSQDRDLEGQKHIELLHKLKKLLVSSESDPEKFDRAAKLIWELKNLGKLQTRTIQDMNGKLSRNFKSIKKELKILFDLQKRFEDCDAELNRLLGDFVVKAGTKIGQKKDVKEIIAGIKQKHEEMLQKAKERADSLHKLKHS